MNKVYRDNTPAQSMSTDGWSRGFKIKQTFDEMVAMGVEITLEQIQAHWDKLDSGYLGE